MPDHLVQPHGKKLINLMIDSEKAEELKKASKEWLSWDLSPRQLCDLELLLTGGFSPLTGFMVKKDYDSVSASMHLSNGILWPIPIILDITAEFAQKLSTGQKLVLRDSEGVMLAVLSVSDIWEPDRKLEAESVYRTLNPDHPGVSCLLNSTNRIYVGGELEGIQLPGHFDFKSLRHTPAELRAFFTKMGWRKIVAFQTRNPMHRAHFELTFRAASSLGANLLIHPVVGMTKPGDVDHFTRVRCYQALTGHYPKDTAALSLLPLAMRMAGPREALWHAIIRKNHGCSHFIVGRDHAGPGSDLSGKPFYPPYEAQELMKKHEEELGISMVEFKSMVYVEDLDTYYPADEVPQGKKSIDISGTELRRRLANGLEIPSWFSFPEVVRELRKTHPPRHKQGFTVFFTGLSGAGKSTIARALQFRFLEIGSRPVTLLDGDIVRKNLSSELGFSREHRDINIRRIGFVASEITKNGGIALCAPIAPYDNIRKEVRSQISSCGGFVLAYISTSLEVCEARDRKGLYAKARAGIVKEFTGISDPYETPSDADLVFDTTDMTPEEAVQRIILFLEHEGYITGEKAGDADAD